MIIGESSFAKRPFRIFLATLRTIVQNKCSAYELERWATMGVALSIHGDKVIKIMSDSLGRIVKVHDL